MSWLFYTKCTYVCKPSLKSRRAFSWLADERRASVWRCDDPHHRAAPARFLLGQTSKHRLKKGIFWSLCGFFPINCKLISMYWISWCFSVFSVVSISRGCGITDASDSGRLFCIDIQTKYMHCVGLSVQPMSFFLLFLKIKFKVLCINLTMHRENYWCRSLCSKFFFFFFPMRSKK